MLIPYLSFQVTRWPWPKNIGYVGQCAAACGYPWSPDMWRCLCESGIYQVISTNSYVGCPVLSSWIYPSPTKAHWASLPPQCCLSSFWDLALLAAHPAPGGIMMAGKMETRPMSPRRGIAPICIKRFTAPQSQPLTASDRPPLPNEACRALPLFRLVDIAPLPTRLVGTSEVSTQQWRQLLYWRWRTAADLVWDGWCRVATPKRGHQGQWRRWGPVQFQHEQNFYRARISTGTGDQLWCRPPHAHDKLLLLLFRLQLEVK